MAFRAYRQVNTAALRKVLDQAGEKATEEAAERVLARAKELCSSQTVAASLRIYKTEKGRFLVGSPLDLAYWIEKGTGIHGPHHSPIVPVSAKVLVFPGKGGGLVFTHSTQGQKARPYLEPALQAVHE